MLCTENAHFSWKDLIDQNVRNWLQTHATRKYDENETN